MYNKSTLLLFASLWSETGMRRIVSDAKIPHHLPILVGTKANSALLMNDLNGEQGLFFVFHDLSVRIEGVFRLKFSLVDLEGSQGLVQKSHVVTTALSEPFTVFTPKAFPGMSDSSDLSKTFAAQGLKIPIRKYRTKILSIKKESSSSTGHTPTPESMAESKHEDTKETEDVGSNNSSVQKQESDKSLQSTQLELSEDNPYKRARTDSMTSVSDRHLSSTEHVPETHSSADAHQPE